jgi:hypothetical protein
MSDSQQGPGWWKASDGKWYPPEQAPATAARPPVTPPSTPPGQLPPPFAAPTGPPAGGGGSMDAAGLVKSLYDFQFDHFVTPKAIRFFYGFFVIVLSVGAALFLLGALASGDSGAIIGGLIAIPIVYAIYLIFGRISFEIIAVIFRMADDLRAIRTRPRG